MAKRSKRTNNSQTKMEGYVVVAFTDDMELAREYEEILQENDIPVSIRESEKESGEVEITLVVPEEYLDEAHVIIESQQAYDDFYDYALDNDSDSDYDDDIFGEDY